MLAPPTIVDQMVTVWSSPAAASTPSSKGEKVRQRRSFSLSPLLTAGASVTNALLDVGVCIMRDPLVEELAMYLSSGATAMLEMGALCSLNLWPRTWGKSAQAAPSVVLLPCTEQLVQARVCNNSQHFQALAPHVHP